MRISEREENLLRTCMSKNAILLSPWQCNWRGNSFKLLNSTLLILGFQCFCYSSQTFGYLVNFRIFCSMSDVLKLHGGMPLYGSFSANSILAFFTILRTIRENLLSNKFHPLPYFLSSFPGTLIGCILNLPNWSIFIFFPFTSDFCF